MYVRTLRSLGAPRRELAWLAYVPDFWSAVCSIERCTRRNVAGDRPPRIRFGGCGLLRLTQHFVHVGSIATLGQFERGQAVFVNGFRACASVNQYPRCGNLVLLFLGAIRAVTVHSPEERRWPNSEHLAAGPRPAARTPSSPRRRGSSHSRPRRGPTCAPCIQPTGHRAEFMVIWQVPTRGIAQTFVLLVRAQQLYCFALYQIR